MTDPRSPEPVPASHGRPDAGTGSEDIADALSQAMTRRVAQVDTTPMTAARAAVEERLDRRARRRQMRRGTLAAALVAVVAASFTIDRWNDDPRTDVATEGVEDNGESRPLREGEASDDPADLGLPRLGLDPSTGLEPATAREPLAQVDEVGASPLGYTHVQIFQPRDAMLPLLIAPWSPDGAEAPLPQGGDGTTTVDVNGIEATLTGQPPGWAVLSWEMPDGTKAYVYASGASEATLLDLARGLRHPSPEDVGYEADVVPSGLVEWSFAGPEPDDLTARYDVGYRGDDREVLLTVGRGSAERWVETLAQMLAQAQSAEPVEVMGEPGLLVQVNATMWNVLWSPGSGIGASLSVAGAGLGREDVEAIAAAVGTVDHGDWVTALAEARS